MGLCQSKPRVGGGGSNCQLGLCRSKKKPYASPWPDLPPELAGHIFARLPSLDDRLRFRAVCRDWRLAAQRHRPLPPPDSTPWIHLAHGAYRSVFDGYGQKTRRRFAVPGRCRATACFGSWVLYEHAPTGRCFLRDPFPGAAPAVEVPCRYHTLNPSIVDGPDVVCGDCQPRPRAAGCYATLPHEHSLVKILACSSSLVVAIFAGSPFDSAPFNFASFRPGLRPLRPLRPQLPFLVKPPPPPPVLFWSPPPVTTISSSGDYYPPHQQKISRVDGEYYCYKEIALHGGKVFAVSSTEELFAHELLDGNHQTPSLSRAELVLSRRPEAPAPWPCATQDCSHHHLVTSSDRQRKLLMVRWNIPHCGVDLGCDRDRRRVMDLQVLEADLERRRWAETKDIGRQDLYVCRTGSRALAAAAGSTEHRGRVFVMVRERASAAALCKCCHCQELVKNGVPTYCIYDMMSGQVSLVSLDAEDCDAPTKYVRLEWFFPACE